MFDRITHNTRHQVDYTKYTICVISINIVLGLNVNVEVVLNIFSFWVIVLNHQSLYDAKNPFVNTWQHFSDAIPKSDNDSVLEI